LRKASEAKSVALSREAVKMLEGGVAAELIASVGAAEAAEEI
jgi:hypothetical protein